MKPIKKIKNIKTSHIIKTIIGFAVVGALIAAYWLTPLREYLSVDKITEMTKDVPKSPTTAAIFLGIFFIGGMTLIPVPLMALAVSLVFGIWMALLIVIPGFFLASISGYGIGRLIDTDNFGDKVQKHVDKIKDKVEEKGAWAVLALRMAPTPPFTITSIIGGALKIDFWKYALGSTIGISPLGLSTVFFGQGVIEMMKEPSGLAASSLVAAAILYVLYFVIKKKQKKKKEQKQNGDEQEA